MCWSCSTQTRRPTRSVLHRRGHSARPPTRTTRRFAGDEVASLIDLTSHLKVPLLLKTYSQTPRRIRRRICIALRAAGLAACFSLYKPMRSSSRRTTLLARRGVDSGHCTARAGCWAQGGREADRSGPPQHTAHAPSQTGGPVWATTQQHHQVASRMEAISLPPWSLDRPEALYPCQLVALRSGTII